MSPVRKLAPVSREYSEPILPDTDVLRWIEITVEAANDLWCNSCLIDQVEYRPLATPFEMSIYLTNDLIPVGQHNKRQIADTLRLLWAKDTEAIKVKVRNYLQARLRERAAEADVELYEETTNDAARPQDPGGIHRPAADSHLGPERHLPAGRRDPRSPQRDRHDESADADRGVQPGTTTPVRGTEPAGERSFLLRNAGMIPTDAPTNNTRDDAMGRKAPVTGSGDGPPREVPPEGNYVALCNGVYMLGTQPGYDNGEAREQLMLSFELHKRKGPARDSNDRIFEASAIMSNTFNIKSTLVKYAGAMRGSAYDEAELEKLKEQGGFDVETLLGLPCRLSIKHEKKADGKTIRDKIESVSRIDLEDDVLPKAETDEVYWDWTTGVECPKRIAWFWDRAAENPKAGKGRVNGNPSHVEAVSEGAPF